MAAASSVDGRLGADRKGLTIAIWLGVLVAFVLAVPWLYRLRPTARPDEDWISTILFAAAWVAWSLFGWLVLLFGIYLGYFAGAYLDLWESGLGQ
jgi:energy-converting hydrogenase Eha subunit A